ncbi:hypothetical protein L7F22_018488 [Adiantum nelumboides]|nr:hypothetical protein [Adiantum nelumboides]
MSSFGDPRVGLLVHLRSLLWAIGIPREQIAEDMQDYERLSLADLEATIIKLQEILRPIRTDEGSSQHPNADATQEEHTCIDHILHKESSVLYTI